MIIKEEQVLLNRLPKLNKIIEGKYDEILVPKPNLNTKLLCKYIQKLYNETKTLINYVEVGVKYGETFICVLEYCKEHNIPFEAYAIDLFDDFKIEYKNTHRGIVSNHKIFKQKLNDLGYNNVYVIKGDSHEVLKNIKPMINVVSLIDGNHTYYYVKYDYLHLKSKTKRGYFIFDDIEPYWVGVNKFYNEIPNNIKVETHKGSGVIKIN